MTPDVQAVGARFRSLESGLPFMAYSAGNVSSIILPKGFFARQLILRLSGTVTTTVASPTGIASEAPLGLIARVEVISDGRRTWVNNDARTLFRLAHIFSGKQPELVPPANLTAGSGAQSFAATIPIYFEAARMVSPVDTYFDTRPYERTELRITWGPMNALATNVNGGTITVNAGTGVTPHLIQSTEGGDNILFNRLHTYDEIPVVATSSNMAIDVQRSGLLHGILIRTDRMVGPSTSFAPADDIINFITLKSDNVFPLRDRIDWNTLQRRNVVDYGLDYAAGGSQADKISGYAFVDLTEDGMIASALNTLDLNQIQLVLDVTSGAGTQLIRASYIFYEPIIGL